jgi:hypothetical protein
MLGKLEHNIHRMKTSMFLFVFSLIRCQPFSLPTMMNTFDRCVSFRTPIMLNMPIKYRNPYMQRKKTKFSIINGFHFYYLSKRFYSICRACHGIRSALKVACTYRILLNHRSIINFQRQMRHIVKCV